MPLRSTSFDAVRRTNGPAVGGSGAGLLDGILQTEGIQSWATLPLQRNGVVRALLSLSSKTPAAFTDDDVDYLGRVARAAQGQVLASIGTLPTSRTA
jgi:hypothetical protein